MFTLTTKSRMIVGIFLLAGFHSFAQSIDSTQHIQVTFNKTSNLVFPAMIKNVDRGSRDVLAQKAKQVENVLQVKAGKRNFQETNLTVITSDGHLHTFILNYTERPQQLNWFIDGVESKDNKDVFFTRSVDDKALQRQSELILSDERRIHLKNASRYGISLSLYGIYVDGKTMFYRLRILNRTNIDYDIESLRFYIIDKQKAKRTASQELDIVPIHTSGRVETITAQSETDLVYTLEKFTIPDAKRLVIELFEHNGGRHQKLSIKNNTIVNARPNPQP
jgi:conjugative transposon TraN protein